MAFANYGFHSGKERVRAFLPLPVAPRATSTPLQSVQQNVDIFVIPPTPVAPVLTRAVSFHCTEPDFDALFDNPQHFRFGYIGGSFDEGTLDYGNSRLSDTHLTPYIDVDPGVHLGHFSETRRNSIARSDSIMNLSFTDMVRKNSEHSQGFMGFRKRMATEINHKYCSYFRCDDTVFIFLHVVFGIVYLSAGVLGMARCYGDVNVNVYLIADGVLSVFLFPINVMEWTRHVGGCLETVNRSNGGMIYVVILIMRTSAVALGTLLVFHGMHGIPHENLVCVVVPILLTVGVSLEWAFLVLAVLLPFCVYALMYCVACRRRSDMSALADNNNNIETNGVYRVNTD
ncbi:uncharacterized protein LOC127877605 isoform X1 [Dreissena polymorpha]|uniref:Uncharacterized protein n=1 Tax=Dreissena polymorpha TaxID=45954 RepID=A0A9D4KQ12_DREPO|nr:uncharacterized protein LOC127877605 isoform X1 [Dreissena polymorpha]KAH3843514.1 hypothetical protein DPMN_117033 [Dreissena polymorpha]